MRSMRELDQGLFHVELYCNNSDCPVREIEVLIKIHMEDDRRSLDIEPACPLCGKPLKIHGIFNSKEYHQRELENAIATVNTALYERDNKDAGLIAIPADVFCMSKLPDQWQCVMAKLSTASSDWHANLDDFLKRKA